MSRFLVDNQLPGALAVWLRETGHEAEHVLDVGLAQASDDSIWGHAARTGATIVTKDEDFAKLVVLRKEVVPVVWLRIGNCRKASLLAAVERTWPMVEEQLRSGARLVEVV